MTQIIVAVAGYHNADKCMEFLVQKTNFSTKNRTYTLPCFTLPIGIQKLLLTVLFGFFFFFGRKNINTQSIEFVKILTRDKYLIHVSSLQIQYSCAQDPSGSLNPCCTLYTIPAYIYICMCICMCVCMCARIYTFDLTCRAYMILKAK